MTFGFHDLHIFLGSAHSESCVYNLTTACFTYINSELSAPKVITELPKNGA
jgi:hypothetical protein